MQAIILAAGMGKRLKKLTQNNPKCMVRVNGVTLIERMLSQLDRKTLDRIIVVVGYMSDALIPYIDSLKVNTPVVFIDNPDYYKTNNIYSLSLAKDYLCDDDTLLLESDLIFEDSVLDMLIDDERGSLALVDKYECWMDGACVKLRDGDRISEFIPGSKFKYDDILSYYKTVNIYKFSKHFSVTHYIPFLDAYSKALGNNEYYEQVLRVITMLDEPEIYAKRLEGQVWYEIDDVQDLDIAESLFASDDDKANLITTRYGGYWRYPKLLNFCDPVNPYFPPERMIDELKVNLERLITAYPSGARVNSLLAAKNLGIEADHTVVANGVEELIKSIIAIYPSDRGIGIVRPINEEYVQRLAGRGAIEYNNPQGEDMEMNTDIDDIVNFYKDSEIGMLIISNPNTHTGEYIEKNEMCRLLKWMKNHDISVLVDESYIDFVDEGVGSLLDDDTYLEYPGLIVLRNLAVSQGLFGLRIGCAVSADESMMVKIRKDLTIWNINSVAEFYMQIFEKYKKIYNKSLEQTRNSRNRLMDDLQKIQGLYPLKSNANFITCKILKTGYSADKLISELMKKNILVKNVSKRIFGTGDYVRIAIRKNEENDRLCSALHDVLEEEPDSSRVARKHCVIDKDSTKKFFDERAEKVLPHRYNYVIYQDSNPTLAIVRDRCEKSRFLPYMHLRNDSEVLDIGCGVGRWADEIVPYLDKGHYTGIDYSEGLLELARKQFAGSDKCLFLHGSFQELAEKFHEKKLSIKSAYDVVLINGILMYINDDEIGLCVDSVADFVNDSGCIYVKESVGIRQRFTLKNFYSEELSHNYNAIYRSIAEYNELFDKAFPESRFELVCSGYTWDNEHENRSETSSYFWIYKKK